MSSNLTIGSIVYGANGLGREVVKVDGDTIVVKTPKGTGTIGIERVIRIDPPPPPKPAPLAVGDTCYYCGSQYWQQYKGMILEVSLFREGYWTCKKPDGYFTTNIPPSELSRPL